MLHKTRCEGSSQQPDEMHSKKCFLLTSLISVMRSLLVSGMDWLPAKVRMGRLLYEAENAGRRKPKRSHFSMLDDKIENGGMLFVNCRSGREHC
jgi:hypothetical protein